MHIFGVPLTVFNYSSQVFPPLLMAAVLGPLYKGLKRLIPENVQLIFVPFLAMLIMIPLTAFIIGPIGVYAGAALAHLLNVDQPIVTVHLRHRHPAGVPVHGAAGPALADQRDHAPEHPDARATTSSRAPWAPGTSRASARPPVCWSCPPRPRPADEADRDGCARRGSARWHLGAVAVRNPSAVQAHLSADAGRMFRRRPHHRRRQSRDEPAERRHDHAFVFTSLLTIPAFNPIGLYAIAIAGAFFTAMFLVIGSNFRTPEQQAEFEAAAGCRRGAGRGGARHAGRGRGAEGRGDRRLGCRTRRCARRQWLRRRRPCPRPRRDRCRTRRSRAGSCRSPKCPIPSSRGASWVRASPSSPRVTSCTRPGRERSPLPSRRGTRSASCWTAVSRS